MALKDSAKKRFVERLTGVVQSSHEKPSSKDQAYDKEVEAVRKDNPQFLVIVKRAVADRLTGKKENARREAEAVRMRRGGKNNDEIFKSTGCQFFGDGRAALVFDAFSEAAAVEAENVGGREERKEAVVLGVAGRIPGRKLGEGKGSGTVRSAIGKASDES